MADLSLTFNNFTQAGDLQFVGGDIALDNPLKTAVLISLFSDRIAPDQLSADDAAVGVQLPGNALNSSDSPRRGWWGDLFGDGNIGSRLWQMRRIVRANKSSVLLEVRAVIYEALDWIVQDGIADQIDVDVQWQQGRTDAVSFSIVIHEPATNSPQNFQFSLAWSNL